MIQIDQQQKMPPAFLKEYGRLYYDGLDAVRDQITIKFTQRPLHQNLSAFFLDNMKEYPSVYLLSWKESETSKTLLIKQAQERQWLKINMNYFPERLAITDAHLFLFGAKEVIIVGLQTKKSKSVKLEDGMVIDFKLCYSEINELGVYVLYFNYKFGYFSKEYSKSSQNSFWGQLKSIFNVITPKKYEQHDFFSIILANLIGISLRKKILIIYDMNNITPTPLQLPFQTQIVDSPVIRWAFRRSNKQLNEELHIFILVKNRIFKYVLHIARFQSKLIEAASQDVSIQSVARGKVIDWDRCIFQKSDLQVVSTLEITDFEVNSQQLIYRQASGNVSQIPIIQRVSLKDFQKKPSIISQQSSLWYEYFRYPENTAHFLNHFKQQIPLQKQVYQTSPGKKILKIDKDVLHYLNRWRKNNQFKGFLCYNDQFYIFRNNGIRAFEVISPLQYRVKNYGNADRLRDEQLKLGNMLKQTKLIDDVAQQEILQEYKSIITSLKGAAQLIYSFNAPNNNSIANLPSKSQFFINLLREKVDYYDQIIQTIYNELKYEQKVYKNSQIIRFIKYLKSCFFNTKLQNNISETNFIILFVERISKSLQQHNQLNFTVFYKKLLKNLLPQSFIASQISPKSIASNEYLDFLIQFMMLNKDEQLTQIAQTELKKLIACVYPELSDKTQPYLLRNKSFVKAYFLSHPKDEELLSFCNKLIKISCYRQVAESLKQIFRLIPNQMDVLIKAELSFKKNSVSSCIFTTSSLEKLGANEELQIRGISEQVSRILMAECNASIQDKNRDEDLNNLKFYFEELFTANLSNYRQIQSQLLKLYQQRYKFEAANQNYSDVLEMEEIMLINLSRLFNHKFDRADFTQPASLAFFQQSMIILLNQLEISFVSYKKYFKKLYDFKRRKVVGGINLYQISKLINEQESLMSSEFIEQPIKIKNNYVSSSLIQILKNIISSQQLLKLSLKNQVNFYIDQLTDQILKDIFAVDSINNSEAELVYFILLKKGERYLRKVFSKVALSAPGKIINYFDRAEDRDVLYEIAEDIIRFDKRFSNQAKLA